MGANDHGVCIGKEAVWTKENCADDAKERLLGMDLVRLGLERGETAQQGLDIITALLDAHGQGGPCTPNPSTALESWGSSSFMICDRSEAWVLETTGNSHWAAEKVTN
ncbi:Secernin-3 [Lamellibrachia satsuma]|nr:Secernin-3 [Lamellibrachia satsuma]